MKSTKTKKRSSTGLARREPREITTAQAKAALKRAGKSGRRSSVGKASSEKQLMNFAMGGAIVGAATATLTKTGGMLDPTKIKEIPGGDTLGAEGLLAIAAHFIGKGKAGTITNVRNAAAAIAVAKMVESKMHTA